MVDTGIILFIVVDLFVIYSILMTLAEPLVGILLFGYLLTEVGTRAHSSFAAASGTILNTDTIFLGLTIAAIMISTTFLQFQTLMISVDGFVAFCISVAGGILAVKFYNFFSKKKINSLFGATGLSAVPMSSRVAKEMALK